MDQPSQEETRPSRDDGGTASIASSVGPWGSMLEDDASQASSAAAGGRVPTKPGVDISKFKSSAERNVWSKRNPVWRLNRVAKPRMACTEDDNQDWSVKYRPKSFLSLLGTHHSDVVGSLQSLLRREQLMRHLVIAGPPGSGKTTLVEIFIHQYFVKGPEEAQRKVMRLNVSELTASHLDMKPRFDAFLASVDRKKEAKASRLIVIDRFSDAEPFVQATVHRFMDELSTMARFILVADGANRVLDRIKASCIIVPVKLIPPSLAVQIVFGVCNNERVGFEREGLLAAYKESEGGSVNRLIDIVHGVWMRYDYVSEENVERYLHPDKHNAKAIEKAAVPVIASLYPLSRCEKCTLVPPCTHITEAILIERALQRRKELPRYRDALVCRLFAKNGACALYNREGHCSLDHPKNIHVLQYPVTRCKLCTLPSPCGFCPYELERRKTQAGLELLKSHVIQLQKKLDAPLQGFFVPPLVLDRLKIEAKNEATRLDGEIARIASATSVDQNYYHHRLKENKAMHNQVMELFSQFVENTSTAKGKEADRG